MRTTPGLSDGAMMLPCLNYPDLLCCEMELALSACRRISFSVLLTVKAVGQVVGVHWPGLVLSQENLCKLISLWYLRKTVHPYILFITTLVP